MKNQRPKYAGLPGALKAARQKYARRSASAVARELGVKQVTLSAWENAQAEPPIAFLATYADYLGCSVDELIGRRPVVGGNVSVTNGNAAVAGHDINGNVGTGACAECARKDAVIAEQQKQIGQLISLVAAAKQH